MRQEVTRRVVDLGASNKPKEAVRELAAMARMGVQPDTVAGTALVHACARNGKMEMAQSVFDELFGSMLAPDAVTFTVLVRGYGSEDPPRWGTIANLLSSMVRDHNTPLTTGGKQRQRLLVPPPSFSFSLLVLALSSRSAGQSSSISHVNCFCCHRNLQCNAGSMRTHQ